MQDSLHSKPMSLPQHFDTILEREKGLQRGLSTDQLSMIAIEIGRAHV